MNMLKKKLSEKLRRNGGFTLVEMLIVVAIIAILIAVSIPLVSNALEKAKHATDAANERAAKAEIILQYLADEDAVIDGTKGKIEFDHVYYYDAANGMISGSRKATYGQHGDHKDALIELKIDENGQVFMVWTKNGTALANIDNTGLCSGSDAATCNAAVR